MVSYANSITTVSQLKLRFLILYSIAGLISLKISYECRVRD